MQAGPPHLDQQVVAVRPWASPRPPCGWLPRRVAAVPRRPPGTATGRSVAPPWSWARSRLPSCSPAPVSPCPSHRRGASNCEGHPTARVRSRPSVGLPHWSTMTDTDAAGGPPSTDRPPDLDPRPRRLTERLACGSPRPASPLKGSSGAGRAVHQRHVERDPALRRRWTRHRATTTTAAWPPRARDDRGAGLDAYDLELQYRVMNLVGERTSVPSPTLVSSPITARWARPSSSWAASDGVVPPDVMPTLRRQLALRRPSRRPAPPPGPLGARCWPAPLPQGTGRGAGVPRHQGAGRHPLRRHVNGQRAFYDWTRGAGTPDEIRLPVIGPPSTGSRRALAGGRGARPSSLGRRPHRQHDLPGLRARGRPRLGDGRPRPRELDLAWMIFIHRFLEGPRRGVRRAGDAEATCTATTWPATCGPCPATARDLGWYLMCWPAPRCGDDPPCSGRALRQRRPGTPDYVMHRRGRQMLAGTLLGQHLAIGPSVRTTLRSAPPLVGGERQAEGRRQGPRVVDAHVRSSRRRTGQPTTQAGWRLDPQDHDPVGGPVHEPATPPAVGAPAEHPAVERLTLRTADQATSRGNRRRSATTAAISSTSTAAFRARRCRQKTHDRVLADGRPAGSWPPT